MVRIWDLFLKSVQGVRNLTLKIPFLMFRKMYCSITIVVFNVKSQKTCLWNVVGLHMALCYICFLNIWLLLFRSLPLLQIMWLSQRCIAAETKYFKMKSTCLALSCSSPRAAKLPDWPMMTISATKMTTNFVK